MTDPERIEQALEIVDSYKREDLGRALWHGAAVSLAAALREAQAENERLREALGIWSDTFVYHLDPCGYLSPGGCTCGLQAAIDATRAALAPAAEEKP